MYTLWLITADSDATFTTYRSKKKAIAAAEAAIISGDFDMVYIEIGNGEQIITDF